MDGQCNVLNEDSEMELKLYLQFSVLNRRREM